MPVRAEASIKDPDSVIVRVAIEMTVDEWHSFLLRVNESSWPATEVSSAVRGAIRKFTAVHQAVVGYPNA